MLEYIEANRKNIILINKSRTFNVIEMEIYFKQVFWTSLQCTTLNIYTTSKVH